METSLSRDNNFQLIRFIAASMVLFSHSFVVITGNYDQEPLGKFLGLDFAELAVDIFFVISGFLVTSSLLHRRNLFSFLWARFLRIYPAAIVNSLFCVFFIGILCTSFPITDYLISSKTYSYLLNNSLLFKFNIYGYLPGTSIVNVSLWTLPWETKAYAALALLAFLWWSRKELIVLTVAIFSIVIFLMHHSITIFNNPVYGHLFRFSSFFFVGSAIYIYRKHIPLSQKYLLTSLIVLLFSVILKMFFFAYILLLPYIVISSAYVIGGFIRNFNKVGDYSYGMYLFAFPIQQSIYHLFPTINIVTMFFSSFLVTLLIAICSWHFIEKTALAFKR